jgi:hypothetical protein
MRDGEMPPSTVSLQRFSYHDLKSIFSMTLDIDMLHIFDVHKMKQVISVVDVRVNEKITSVIRCNLRLKLMVDYDGYSCMKQWERVANA